jgi:hypothetical protein
MHGLGSWRILLKACLARFWFFSPGEVDGLARFWLFSPEEADGFTEFQSTHRARPFTLGKYRTSHRPKADETFSSPV